MPAIVECSCGAKVRVPDGPPTPLRCPRCQTPIVGPAAAPPPPAPDAPSPPPLPTDIPPGIAVATCPICQTAIASDQPTTPCPTCGQLHHQECWTEIGGCAVYGCASAPSVAKAPEGHVTSAWGDNKKCPLCGETIKAIAVKCRYCGAAFDTVDPLSVHDVKSQTASKQAYKSAGQTSVTLFVLSILGILAPLTLLIGGIWVRRNRFKLARAGPVYVVLGYASIGISVIYCIIMTVLWMTS